MHLAHLTAAADVQNLRFPRLLQRKEWRWRRESGSLCIFACTLLHYPECYTSVNLLKLDQKQHWNMDQLDLRRKLPLSLAESRVKTTDKRSKQHRRRCFCARTQPVNNHTKYNQNISKKILSTSYRECSNFIEDGSRLGYTSSGNPACKLWWWQLRGASSRWRGSSLTWQGWKIQ